MFYRLARKAVKHTLIVLAFLAAAGNASAVTQREFAQMIISGFGWGDGLPKEPVDRDFLVVFAGKRTFRYEAENVYNAKSDNVVLRNYPLYGQFSGNGWLMGVSTGTSVNFTVFVPLAGEYSLSAVIKGTDFAWQVGDTVLRGGNPAGVFSEVGLGRVRLQPGLVQIRVAMPPEGGIDAFLLAAADLMPIQPMEGWRFKDQLTALQMAQVGVALMDAYGQLPADATKKQNIAAVDAAAKTPDVVATTANFLGTFKSSAWLRAGAQGAEVKIPLSTPEAGYYEIKGQIMGEQLSGDINGTTFSVQGKPFLDAVTLGMFRLEKGANMLNLHLPPNGGVDELLVAGKSLAPRDVMRLAGIDGSPDRLVTAEEAQQYIANISGKYQVRK